jgi:cytochrome b pre-mRNA-processing protein 3
MMPLRLLRRRRNQVSADALYMTLVEQARRPVFYADLGVPDTVDGRFDMIALHAFLLLHRLRGEPTAASLGQDVFDLMFGDMDRNLREMGVGDLSIGKRIKTMASAFNGRIAAYDAALSADDPHVLDDALRRNLFRGTAPATGQVAALAAYVRDQAAVLTDQPLERLLAGEVAFTLPQAALA